MPTLTDSDVEAQRIIDEKISEYEAAILELKTRRNTHSAISKFPAEIMANIFLHVRHDAQEPYSLTFRFNMRWLTIYSVCRQWRAIALDTPRLWCYIDLSWDAQRALDILARSKSVPLCVRCWADCYHSVPWELVSKTVMSQRVQELALHIADIDSLVHFLESIQSGAAAALEVFKLTAWSKDVIALPRGGLWNNMLALRVLEIGSDKLAVSSPLPLLPHLTRFTLRCSIERELSTSWLLQSLRNTPAIQEIDISGLSSDFGTEIPMSPRISLPKLTFLSISGLYLGTSQLFDIIDYPISAIVSYMCGSLSTSSDFSSLHRLCSRYSTRGGASLPEIDRVRIDVGCNVFAVKLLPSDKNSPHLTLLFSERPRSFVARWIQLCSMLPLAAIRTLDLLGFYDESSEGWLTLLPPLPQLTTLCLSECRMGVLLGLLRTGDAQKPPLERLETIKLSRYSFRRGNDHDAMIAILASRKKHGMAIRKLIFTESWITKDVINDFKGYVEVDYDSATDK